MGLASIWGRAMYPELARVVDKPTRRKSIAPRPTHGRGTRLGAMAANGVPSAARSPESAEEQSDATSDDGDSLECPAPNDEPVHAVPKAADPPLLSCPPPGDTPSAVAVEAVVQLGASAAGVGGAGGEVRQVGCAEGPIMVDSDVDTSDDSGESGGEPDGSFTVGLASPSPAGPGGRPSSFVGRERPGWKSAPARGPVRGTARWDRRAGVVGRVFRVYNGPLGT